MEGCFNIVSPSTLDLEASEKTLFVGWWEGDVSRF